MTGFKDEPFHDAMAEFLRGFDRAMQAIDTKKPENPVDRSRAAGSTYSKKLELQASGP